MAVERTEMMSGATSAIGRGSRRSGASTRVDRALGRCVETKNDMREPGRARRGWACTQPRSLSGRNRVGRRLRLRGGVFSALVAVCIQLTPQPVSSLFSIVRESHPASGSTLVGFSLLHVRGIDDSHSGKVCAAAGDKIETKACLCSPRRLRPDEEVRSAPHYSSSSSPSSCSPRSRRPSSSSSSTSNTHSSSKRSGHRPGTSSSKLVSLCPSSSRDPHASGLHWPRVMRDCDGRWADVFVHYSHRTTSVLLNVHLPRLYVRRLARRLPLSLSNGREVRHPGRDRFGGGCLRLRPRLRQGDGCDARVSLRNGGGGGGGRSAGDRFVVLNRANWNTRRAAMHRMSFNWERRAIARGETKAQRFSRTANEIIFRRATPNAFCVASIAKILSCCALDQRGCNHARRRRACSCLQLKIDHRPSQSCEFFSERFGPLAILLRTTGQQSELLQRC